MKKETKQITNSNNESGAKKKNWSKPKVILIEKNDIENKSPNSYETVSSLGPSS